MSNDEKLEIKSVDLHPLENAEQHHTDKFEIVHQKNPNIVLRRAQPFHLDVSFSGRGYDNNRDVMQFIFSFGNEPNFMIGTKALVTLTEKKRPDDETWHARLEDSTDHSIDVEIYSPPNIPVGKWQLEIVTKHKETTGVVSPQFKYPQPIYLLFNPWAEADHVHMEDEHLLDEYVLSDVGKIWKEANGRQWIYGQFDAIVLPAIDLMMEINSVAPKDRGNPIVMGRAISKIVNSNDDSGVVSGKWIPPYDDGILPYAWNGSVPILEQYLKTGRAVKYGQCWVFAGVVNTVCRALGMPCRVVTNLGSAHDSDASLTIDYYYDNNNERHTKDSIWNFHVWNDVWMARPDLPNGYGGWQAIDATPQEKSEGVSQCGPASLEAIKRGAVGFNYDVAFIIAEVNADVVSWKEDKTSDLGYTKISTDKRQVGKNIITKKPGVFDPKGDTDMYDIIEEYKHKEGSTEENLQMLNAANGSEKARKVFMLPSKSREDIDFEFVDLEKVNLGESFSITVNVNNRSDQERTVDASLSASSFYYTGIKAHEVKKETGEFKLAPKSKKQLQLTVNPEEYVDKLVEYCNMKIFAIATVLETNETWANEDDFVFLKPSLEIKISENPVVGSPCFVSFSFKNPLKMTLTNCKFHYEGPGLVRSTMIDYRDVEPEEEVKIEHHFNPQRPGNQKMVAVFNSEELVDITGSISFKVSGQEE